MSEWLRLGDMPAKSPEGPVPDVVVGVVLSPYDVPEAVRGLRTSSGRFRIEFRYVDGEESGKEVRVGQHVVATEGRYSGRLLAMEVDVEAIGAHSVGVSIDTGASLHLQEHLNSAWDAVAQKFGEKSSKQQSITAARRAVTTRETDLLQQFQTTC